MGILDEIKKLTRPFDDDEFEEEYEDEEFESAASSKLGYDITPAGAGRTNPVSQNSSAGYGTDFVTTPAPVAQKITTLVNTSTTTPVHVVLVTCLRFKNQS